MKNRNSKSIISKCINGQLYIIKSTIKVIQSKWIRIKILWKSIQIV